ncbi:MAG: ABC transporter permease [Proteobacteria bacterium]|nr:ABC transporter permease [Pseudomonadota bacterium]MBU1742694.1 ABC transporter permease [Pseudomonadota bacterium]
MKTLRCAWRNLWRNPRRTMVTMSAVGFGTAVLIVSLALMDGVVRQMVSNATNLVVGEVQVHAPGYLADRDLYKTVRNPEAVLAAARARGVAAAPRSFGYGLVALGHKSSGALFWGVDPAAEARTFDLARHVRRGSFLSLKAARGMVLGSKLARSLKAEVGSEIVVVVQAADGSMGNELYRVRGILKTVGDQIDRAAVIIHAADFRRLFVSGGRIHEIALNSRARLPLDQVAALARGAASGNEVKTWRQILPAVSEMLNLVDASILVFGFIFVLAAGLGVMNTMLMATYDRIREFGIMKALGAGRWRIVGGVATEALLLSVVASAAGVLIGLAGAYYFQAVGLDTSVFAGSYSLGGVAFDSVWRAAIRLRSVLVSVGLMVAVCVLVSAYPGLKAARLDPVKAITRV